MGLADIPVPAPPSARIWATKSGHSSTGSRHASCAQYSNTRPCPSSRGTMPGLYAPTRDASAIRWLRSTAEIESSWTHESRRIAASTSAVEPARERVA